MRTSDQTNAKLFTKTLEPTKFHVWTISTDSSTNHKWFEIQRTIGKYCELTTGHGWLNSYNNSRQALQEQLLFEQQLVEPKSRAPWDKTELFVWLTQPLLVVCNSLSQKVSWTPGYRRTRFRCNALKNLFNLISHLPQRRLNQSSQQDYKCSPTVL